MVLPQLPIISIPTMPTNISSRCIFIVAVTNTLAEMVTYNPISSPFIRFAGRYIDEAVGVATGYNFFIFEATLVPFEIVACNLIIKYWTDIVPDAAMLALVLVLYALINLFGVRAYGESEFWLAIGKMILIVGLLIYTFVTMLGGNPQKDRYGFRYWKDPGAFAEYYKTGSLGRFMGFMTCLCQAAFTVAGPDYVSMAAGEAANPRVVMPRAYKAVVYRLTIFFVLGALAVGINVPYNDPDLKSAYAAGAAGAKASPYVVGMDRLKIKVLPDIVNAMILASAFSAGNSYVYCASRSLYGLALEGKAPKVLRTCTKHGVPVYCVGVVLAISLLSFLSVSNTAQVVLDWFINLVTASQLINFTVISFTFLKWKAACEAQGLDRNLLPYKSKWQPYQAYFAMIGTGVMVFIGGYEVFLPGKWNVTTFIFSYCMVGVFPVIVIGWKLVKKTKYMTPETIILRTREVVEIEEYSATYVEPPMSKGEKGLDMIFG